MTFKSVHINVSINCPADQVYEFILNPLNLPKWASGLSASIKNINGEWIAESPNGKVKVKFVEKNPFGVLDHWVTLPDGAEAYIPLRILSNNRGSELIFTLYQLPEMSDQFFAEDIETVKKDLWKLKTLLE